RPAVWRQLLASCRVGWIVHVDVGLCCFSIVCNRLCTVAIWQALLLLLAADAVLMYALNKDVWPLGRKQVLRLLCGHCVVLAGAKCRNLAGLYALVTQCAPMGGEYIK
ncbi:hypothetical protein COO60DRAFT_1485913, partial [Scenedesmus sp. NREL 46B-D3]